MRQQQQKSKEEEEAKIGLGDIIFCVAEVGAVTHLTITTQDDKNKTSTHSFARPPLYSAIQNLCTNLSPKSQGKQISIHLF